MKIVYSLPIIFFITTGAACNPASPIDICGEIPIYQPYNIDVPVRPVLQSDKVPSTDTPEGTAVRSSVLDMLLLQEYAEKLENIIKSIPKNISVPK